MTDRPPEPQSMTERVQVGTVEAWVNGHEVARGYRFCGDSGCANNDSHEPIPFARSIDRTIAALTASKELAVSFACRCSHHIKHGFRECAYHKRLRQIAEAYHD